MAKFEVGQVWRAKRPRNANGFVNDRVIRYIGPFGHIQYDGPAVAIGRKFPIAEPTEFEKWAGRLVTDELPPGEWQTWGFENGNNNK